MVFFKLIFVNAYIFYRFNSDDENVEPVFVLSREQEHNNNLPNVQVTEDPEPVQRGCL